MWIMMVFNIFATLLPWCCFFAFNVFFVLIAFNHFNNNELELFCADRLACGSRGLTAMFCIFATGALYFAQQLAEQSAVKKCPGALCNHGKAI